MGIRLYFRNKYKPEKEYCHVGNLDWGLDYGKEERSQTSL